MTIHLTEGQNAHVMLSLAERHTRLLTEAFRQTPTFRVSRFDAHVKAWRNRTCAEIWRTYHTDPAFKAAYEARVALMHAEPMPAWKGV